MYEANESHLHLLPGLRKLDCSRVDSLFLTGQDPPLNNGSSPTPACRLLHPLGWNVPCGSAAASYWIPHLPARDLEKVKRTP